MLFLRSALVACTLVKISLFNSTLSAQHISTCADATATLKFAARIAHYAGYVYLSRSELQVPVGMFAAPPDMPTSTELVVYTARLGSYTLRSNPAVYRYIRNGATLAYDATARFGNALGKMVANSHPLFTISSYSSLSLPIYGGVEEVRHSHEHLSPNVTDSHPPSAPLYAPPAPPNPPILRTDMCSASRLDVCGLGTEAIYPPIGLFVVDLLKHDMCSPSGLSWCGVDTKQPEPLLACPWPVLRSDMCTIPAMDACALDTEGANYAPPDPTALVPALLFEAPTDNLVLSTAPGLDLLAVASWSGTPVCSLYSGDEQQCRKDRIGMCMYLLQLMAGYYWIWFVYICLRGALLFVVCLPRSAYDLVYALDLLGRRPTKSIAVNTVLRERTPVPLAERMDDALSDCQMMSLVGMAYASGNELWWLSLVVPALFKAAVLTVDSDSRVVETEKGDDKKEEEAEGTRPATAQPERRSYRKARRKGGRRV